MSDYQWIEFAKDKFVWFFYFCGKFEPSFFNILSLKVIGVVLPPAGRRTWCLSHQQSTSSAFIVFQLHPNTRKCQTN